MRIPPLPALLGLLMLLPTLAAAEDPADGAPASPPVAAAEDDSDEGGTEGGGSSDGSDDGGSTSSTRRSSDDEAEARPRKGKKDVDPLIDEGKRKRIIKIVQRKDFLKFHRVEVTPMFGYVSNDPFLSRILAGANIAYHVNELFSLEWFLAYSPNLGRTDYKALTNELLTGTEVVPDISRIQFIGAFDIGMSPIFGKIELGTLKIINYDLYLLIGLGVVQTADDAEIIEGGDPRFLNQWHLATNFGFGFRVAFNQFFALRLEGRSYIHIEQVDRDQLNLEMKNNFAIQLGASFFLPPKVKSSR
ncbi:outer membrane beta-barrel domain-containing protein [Myxococcota bacterium]|nr:outer membrane beta-barrel domain-containing protein [Myxococcota bacterium]